MTNMFTRKKIPGMPKRQHLELLHVLTTCSSKSARQYQQKWMPELQRKFERLGMLGLKDEVVALATIHKMRCAHPAMTQEEKAESRAWLTDHDMSEDIRSVPLPEFESN